MRKSKGFLLVYDLIVFLLCSMLILSAASAWKTCIMHRQQYHKLNEAVYGIENCIVNDGMQTSGNITLSQQGIKTGRLKELQAWEDDKHEQLLVNLFIVEAKD